LALRRIAREEHQGIYCRKRPDGALPSLRERPI
jgi:hypothetical protein